MSSHSGHIGKTILTPKAPKISEEKHTGSIRKCMSAIERELRAFYKTHFHEIWIKINSFLPCIFIDDKNSPDIQNPPMTCALTTALMALIISCQNWCSVEEM